MPLLLFSPKMFPSTYPFKGIPEILNHWNIFPNLCERSGHPDTSDVLQEKGIYDLCKGLDVDLINFEKLPPDSWIKVKPGQSHWRNGFDVAKPVLDSECVVATCCLKTHGFGGVFTVSLKLSVGITHKRNMREHRKQQGHHGKEDI